MVFLPVRNRTIKPESGTVDKRIVASQTRELLTPIAIRESFERLRPRLNKSVEAFSARVAQSLLAGEVIMIKT